MTARTLRANWFYLLLPFAAFASYSLAAAPEAIREPLVLERVLLADWALLVPLFYALYLRGRVPTRALVLRSLAMAGAGIWFAGWLMPEGQGALLPWLGWLRVAFLPIAIVIELAAFVAIISIAYSAVPDRQKLIDSGMPPLLARLLIAEARLWKRVFAWLTGKD